MRNRLPDRRHGWAVTYRVGKLQYRANLSIDEEGVFKEVFLTTGKTGSEAFILARDLGIITSLLLQHGCAIETIAKALTRSPDGTGDGPLGILLDKIIKKE